MKIIKPPLSLSIIYWFTNIVFGLLLIVTIAAIIFNVLLHTEFFGNDMQLHTSFPAKIDILEKGVLYLNDREIEVEFVEATTRIHFLNTPDFITKKVGIALLIILSFILYLTWEFRKFVVNVKHGSVFTLNNILSLKKIAYGLVAMWLFTVVYMRLAYYYLANNITFEQVVITDDIPNFAGFLMLALFVWVLAHIFMTGLKMKKEQDLTI